MITKTQDDWALDYAGRINRARRTGSDAAILVARDVAGEIDKLVYENNEPVAKEYKQSLGEMVYAQVERHEFAIKSTDNVAYLALLRAILAVSAKK